MRKNQFVRLSGVLPVHLRTDRLQCGVLLLIPTAQTGGARTEAGGGRHCLVPLTPPQLSWKQEKISTH